MSRFITLRVPRIRRFKVETDVEPILVNIERISTVQSSAGMSPQTGYDWDQVESVITFQPGWIPVIETISQIQDRIDGN